MLLNSSDASVCATALRGGSKSFHAASRLLPARVRDAATGLYAFCRDADDAIDHAPPAQRASALASLHARLAAIYAGTPAPIAADRAFARVVAAHDLPEALPRALLEGFAWDAEGRRYATLRDLEDYAARVAGTVGTMMAVIMGARGAATLARAAELGLAMQLTNIARDVGEDARAGRIYVPLDWLAEAGLTADDVLCAREASPALLGVIGRLLAHADALYARAARGIAALPADCRTAIHAARLLYAAIGHAAGRPGFDPVRARAVVPARVKAVLVAQAGLCALGDCVAQAADPAPVLGAVAALVDAASLPDAVVARRAPVWRRAEEKAVWVLDLFAELDARERQGRMA